jgi:CelD/BcsL family acetyltransferase involved in cellulose biosynthesis
METRETSGEPCPFIPLPETWQDFLGTLGKKTRSNIGYYERSLYKVYDVQIGWITEADQLDPAMDALFLLHQRRWNKRWLPGVFGSPKTQAFHKDIARALLAQGHLRLFRIVLDSEIQAVLYCFAFGDRICYYQGGFEPSLSRLSLGTVLTASAIRTAIEEKREVFDFLRGDEEYKAKWTSQAAVNMRRIAVKSPILSPLANSAQKTEHALEMRAKAWARRLR